MRYEQDSCTFTRQVPHTLNALAYKIGITSAQYFIDYQNVWYNRGGYRECQPRVHSSRVFTDRTVYKVFQLGEINDSVDSSVDSSLRQPLKGKRRSYVVGTGEIRMKACAQFHQSLNSSSNLDASRIWPHLPTDDAQKGALTDPTNQCYLFAALNGQADLVERDKFISILSISVHEFPRRRAPATQGVETGETS